VPIKDAEDEFIGAREILGRRNFLIPVEQTDRQRTIEMSVNTDDVDDLLQNEPELDDERRGVVDDRSFQSVVAARRAEQVVEQPLLVRSLHCLCDDTNNKHGRVVLARGRADHSSDSFLT